MKIARLTPSTEKRKLDVRHWIQPVGTPVEESNLRHQRRGGKAFSVCACPYPWLLDSPNFKAWMDQTNDCRGLWLKGGSGTGKSVLYSYAVTLAKSKALDAGVAFHYYRFEESSSSLTLAQTTRNQYSDTSRRVRGCYPIHHQYSIRSCLW
jgi:hypothetical protein